METPMESVTSTLIQRVETLLQDHDAPREWGIPLWSSTLRSHAVHDLAVPTDALEHAVRAIARELQKPSAKT